MSSPQQQRWFQVDAFSRRAYSGNPAAVLITKTELGEFQMQGIASEMNLSETAFLVPRDKGFKLRWFTPEAEVDLCGHATLASAHVLYEEGYCTHGEKIEFYTRSGTLYAEKRNDHICLEFPAQTLSAMSDIPEPISLQNLEIEEAQRNDWLIVLRLKDEAAVRNYIPDFGRLAQLNCGVAVTAPSATEERDFVSRCFFPHLGINEDPVTGAAHCALGPYWAARLDSPRVKGEQGLARRGIVHIEVLSNDRVELAGQCAMTFKGLILEYPQRD